MLMSPWQWALTCQRSKGHEVLQALEDQEDIDVAKWGTPDRILPDIQLPSMDGYKVARTLPTNPDLFVVPIAAVTSQAIVRDREKTLN